ncbi:MAG: Selenide, water dikinase [Candidatus Binatus sp.]|nr:Selenide, water dikinase [Candidatus Binatus sp.]
MLARLELPSDPDLLVGINTGDDAGVFRLSDDLAIVNTVDFFTPVVDDPFTYGQIAAANALSDVYAMGGVPRTALNIVCWPQTGLPGEMLAEILRGGSDKVREAGALIVGGHTVADEEVKFGMAITGVIDPRRIVRNVGAKIGDALILSKPLGIGILMTAFKRDRLSDESYQAAVRSMCQLNASAAATMLKYDVHAATDVTGFGLVGHAMKMAEGSGVTIIFEESDLPLLPDALELCRAGMIPGGGARNREYYGPKVRISDEIADEMAELAFDPQTSGGLLVAVPAEEAIAMLAELQNSGHREAAIVGRVVARGSFAIELV